jgi:hypothetical protein
MPRDAADSTPAPAPGNSDNSQTDARSNDVAQNGSGERGDAVRETSGERGDAVRETSNDAGDAVRETSGERGDAVRETSGDGVNSMMQSARQTGSQLWEQGKPIVEEDLKKLAKENWKEIAFGDGPATLDARTWRANERVTLGPTLDDNNMGLKGDRAAFMNQMRVYAIQPRDPPPPPPEESIESRLEKTAQHEISGQVNERVNEIDASEVGRYCNNYIGNGDAQTRDFCQVAVDKEKSIIESFKDGVGSVQQTVEQIKANVRAIGNLKKKIIEDLWCLECLKRDMDNL